MCTIIIGHYYYDITLLLICQITIFERTRKLYLMITNAFLVLFVNHHKALLSCFDGSMWLVMVGIIDIRYHRLQISVEKSDKKI